MGEGKVADVPCNATQSLHQEAPEAEDSARMDSICMGEGEGDECGRCDSNGYSGAGAEQNPAIIHQQEEELTYGQDRRFIRKAGTEVR